MEKEATKKRIKTKRQGKKGQKQILTLMRVVVPLSDSAAAAAAAQWFLLRGGGGGGGGGERLIEMKEKCRRWMKTEEENSEE